MANLYWVGGSLGWDGTAGTKWATTSGGAGGAAIPTAADDVFIDANSGAVTVTLVVGNTGCRSLDFTGFTGAFAGSTSLAISGNLVLSTTMTQNYNGPLTFNSTTARTITSNGKSILNNVTFDGVGGSWQLQDNLNGASSTTVVTLTNGTFDLNGFTCFTRTFISNNSNTRVLTFGGGNITSAGNGATMINGTTTTGLTINGTPTFNLTYAGATSTRTIVWGVTGGTEARSIIVNITAGTDILAITTASKLRALNLTGSSVSYGGSSALTLYGSLTLSSTMTWTATGLLTFSNTSGTAVLTPAGKTFSGGITMDGVGGTLQLQANGTFTGTFTLTNGTVDLNAFTLQCSIFSSNNSNTRAIITGTGGAITCTTNNATIISGATLTGLTITGSLTVSLTYSGSTGTRTINWGGTAGATLARAISVSITAGNDTLSLAVGCQFQNLSFGSTANWANIASGAISVAGNMTFFATMSISFTGTVTFNGTSGTPQEITTNGKNLGSMLFVFNGVGGSFKLMDNLLILTTLTLTNGTLDLNGKNVDITTFALGAGTKTLTIGSGYLGIGASTAAAFDAATNASGLTVSAATGQIRMGGSTAKTFKGGGFSWPILVQSQVGALTIEGANTFADIQRTNPGDIILPASTTTTVLALTLGSSGAFKSSSAGVAATVSKSSGTVSISNTTLTDSTATGGATFNSLGANGCIDGGNNTGWFFGASVNCYWVGGTDSWDGTPGTKWAATSGGAGGAPIPTIIDDVFLDSASGAGTVTIAAGNTGARSVATTGFTGTVSGSTAISVAGNLNVGSGTTWSYTGTITFISGSARTITTNGKAFGGSITFDGVGGSWQLQDNFNGNSATTTVTLTNGTFDLSTFTCFTRIFASSNGNTRGLIFGSGGNITSAGNGGTLLSCSTVTGMTISGSPIFNFTYASNSGTRTLTWGVSGGSETVSPIINVTAGSDILAVTTASKLRALNLTGSSVTQSATTALILWGSFTMSSTAAWNSTGLLTFGNTSGTAVFTSAGKSFVCDITINAIGGTFQLADNFTSGNASLLTLTAGTLDLNGKTMAMGVLSTSNANTRNITSGTGGKLSLAGNATTIISGANLFNFSITGALTVDCTYAGATGTRTVNWGGSTSGSLATRAFDLNIKAGTDIIAFAGYVWTKSLDYTGFNGTMAAGGTDLTCGGNLTLSAGMTYSATSDIYFDTPGPTHQITSAGKVIPGNIFFDDPAGVYTLMDDINAATGAGSAVFQDLGTLDLNGHIATFSSFFIAAGNGGLAFGSGQIIATSGSDPIDASAVTGDPYTITWSAGAKISLTAATAKDFSGGDHAWPPLSQDGAGVLTILQNNTFDDIQRTVTGDIQLQSGKTQTLLALTLGSSGAFRSDTAGVPATVSKASGTVTVSNATITDSIATGGATFNAPTTSGNVDGGGNTGWIFGTAPAAPVGNFFRLFRPS